MLPPLERDIGTDIGSRDGHRYAENIIASVSHSLQWGIKVIRTNFIKIVLYKIEVTVYNDNIRFRIRGPFATMRYINWHWHLHLHSNRLWKIWQKYWGKAILKWLPHSCECVTRITDAFSVTLPHTDAHIRRSLNEDKNKLIFAYRTSYNSVAQPVRPRIVCLAGRVVRARRNFNCFNYISAKLSAFCLSRRHPMR